jgi:hypothetical protein
MAGGPDDQASALSINLLVLGNFDLVQFQPYFLKPQTELFNFGQNI